MTRYPIYIISKGRWESRMTSKALERMNVAYNIVVEPQELAQYASVIAREKILVLPFSNLGQGSIPARNWVWEHAKSIGADRHWILDDNIKDFLRLHNNMKLEVLSDATFCAAEDFVDRYENVAIAGFQYRMFAPQRTAKPPFFLNTRIYSCILIRNDLQLGVEGVGQWRGRYNEDTDLSIRALKAGFCTMIFFAFLCDKTATMTMKGGNTEDLYLIEDGRLKMARSLVEQHPDVTTITRKWGRWQHHVDYRPFKRNKLIRRSDAIFPDGVNNYGMVLKEFAPEESRIEAPIYSETVIETPRAPKEDRTSIEYFAKLQDLYRSGHESDQNYPYLRATLPEVQGDDQSSRRHGLACKRAAERNRVPDVQDHVNLS